MTLGRNTRRPGHPPLRLNFNFFRNFWREFPQIRGGKPKEKRKMFNTRTQSERISRMEQMTLKDERSGNAAKPVLLFMATLLWWVGDTAARAQLTNVLQKIPNTTLQMPKVPQSYGYQTQPAFGGLTFSSPVSVRSPLDETNRLFVAEQAGRIFVITNLAVPTKTLFLDVSRQVLIGQISGLFALEFHPGYA